MLKKLIRKCPYSGTGFELLLWKVSLGFEGKTKTGLWTWKVLMYFERNDRRFSNKLEWDSKMRQRGFNEPAQIMSIFLIILEH